MLDVEDEDFEEDDFELDDVTEEEFDEVEPDDSISKAFEYILNDTKEDSLTPAETAADFGILLS